LTGRLGGVGDDRWVGTEQTLNMQGKVKPGSLCKRARARGGGGVLGRAERLLYPGDKLGR